MGDLFVKPQAKSGSIRRGLSPTLWHQAPLVQIISGDLGEGFVYMDDFLTYEDHRYTLTQANSSGTAVLDDAKGGVLLLDSASGTDERGPQIQMLDGTVGESILPSAAAKIYFEARIKVADIGTSGSDTVDMFLGLSIADTTIVTASGGNTSTNHIGFEHVTDNDGNLDFHSESGGSRSNSLAVDTLSDGTYVKLGFIVDGTSSVTPYVNGVAGTAITSNIPTTEMAVSFVCMSAGTTDPIMHIDWFAVCQAEQISN